MSRLSAVILTALITAIVTSVVWICVIGIGYLYYNRGGDVLAMKVNAPVTVEVGEEFALVVEVSNPNSDDVEFGSIDIYEDLLNGFEVLGVTPVPYDIDPSLGFASHYYSQTLAPGQQVEVRFSMKATTEGRWSGDIDTCTDLGDFVTEVTSIEVVSPPVSPPAGEDADKP